MQWCGVEKITRKIMNFFSSLNAIYDKQIWFQVPSNGNWFFKEHIDFVNVIQSIKSHGQAGLKEQSLNYSLYLSYLF